MMEEVMQQVDELKAKLDENPADTATLVEMYGLYSMVGKFEEVQPYLENWLSEVESNADLDKDAKWEEATKLLELTTSANHIEGTKALMQFYQRTEPDNVFFIRALGDICYNLDQFQESADYYSRYLELSSPEEDGENYWGARVDRATMLMAMAEENNEPEKLEESVIELQQVTQDYPELWQAWFNLGKAYLAKEDETQAEETFKIALTRSRNSMDEWLAESELAKLRGEEPPPMPASPHGSMDGSGGGNFHGTP